MTGPCPKLDLPDVTLVAATSVALKATIRALDASIAQVNFGKVLLLTDKKPADSDTATICWRAIDPMRSRADYSRFMLGQLACHIETKFALIVQWDGYVTNASRWNPSFLDYDYIGAPWPHFRDGITVGNGGFSLRSRKLLEACRTLPESADSAEDVTVCRTYRALLEGAHDIRFAPEALAQEFAFERIPRTGREFGFHGVFNMFEDHTDNAFASLLSTLEPGLLGRLESKELVRLALRHRRPATLFQAIRQRIVRMPFF